MHDGGRDTVLLVCNDEAVSAELSESLQDFGFGVVGPISRAFTALTLTAQTPPTVAVIASELSGRRSAVELAETLMSTWGVRSWIWGAETPVDGALPWAVGGEQLERLRRAFDRGTLQAA